MMVLLLQLRVHEVGGALLRLKYVSAMGLVYALSGRVLLVPHVGGLAEIAGEMNVATSDALALLDISWRLQFHLRRATE